MPEIGIDVVAPAYHTPPAEKRRRGRPRKGEMMNGRLKQGSYRMSLEVQALLDGMSLKYGVSKNIIITMGIGLVAQVLCKEAHYELIQEPIAEKVRSIRRQVRKR